MRLPRRFLAILAWAVVVALAAAVWLLVSRPQTTKPVSGPTEMGGPFTLIDQTGRRVTEGDLKDKPTLLLFGYTNSPEVCPNTLADLSADLKALGPQADELHVFFVTVDPERDTPQRLSAYLAKFDPHIRGLTGTAAEIRQITQDYAIYYHRIPQKDGGYSMDHSYNIYLFTARGHVFDVVGYPLNRDGFLGELRKLVRGHEP